MVTPITVLCACYQGEKWLPVQLDSLKKQDDPCFSVLMQDDGSADSTLSLLQAAAAQDQRFKLAGQCGRHLGAAGNFISLLSQVNTGWVAFCDQDDLWEADRLSACRAAMEKAEQTYGKDCPILIHSDCRLIDEQGSTVHESFFAHQGWSGDALQLNSLLVQNNVTGCTMLMNQPLCALVSAHAVPEKMFMHDWFIAQTAACFGHIVFINRPLVNYRQHGSNVLGASKSGILSRAVKALTMPKAIKKRIQLCYDQAQLLMDCYQDTLPASSRDTLKLFLSIPKKNKLQRVQVLRQNGFLMQSKVTRIGQLIFS